jgi:two-component system, LytTR family, response regulator
MKIWKALIVDDELLARKELRRMLLEHSHIDVRGEADSMHDAEEAIGKLSPDIIFLDIDLGPHTGFDLLEKVARNFRIIFVTAYDEYAVRAFKVNALDYLLKPIHPERLKEAVSRLGNPYHQKTGIQLEPFDKILVSHRRYSRLITVSSISYIEACGDYSCVYTRDGFRGTLHHTIKRWMERLPGKLFIQSHRSYIVNTDRIKRLDKRGKESFEIALDQPEAFIPVSRGYSRNILATFRLS